MGTNMSTRASIVIESGKEKAYVYRHHDGYPENVEPTLQLLLGKIRKGHSVEIVAGWLILIGFLESNQYKIQEGLDFSENCATTFSLMDYITSGCDYEITTCIHGDESYIYEVDVPNQKITTYTRTEYINKYYPD